MIKLIQQIPKDIRKVFKASETLKAAQVLNDQTKQCILDLTEKAHMNHEGQWFGDEGGPDPD